MDQNENWLPPSEEFSLETIGIGNVFVKTAICELVGNIKSCPEDFVVREILGDIKHSKYELSKAPFIANIVDATTLPNIRNDFIPKEESKVDLRIQDATKDDDDQKELVSQQNQSHIHLVSSPESAVQTILCKCIKDLYAKIPLTEESYYQQIQTLYDESLCDLKSYTDSYQKLNHKVIIIPPFSDDTIVQLNHMDDGGSKEKRNRNRSTFHQTLKLIFPLLKTSTCTEEESIEWMQQCDLDSEQNKNDRCIKVEKDESFHPLIPYLMNPKRDLVELYRFRNHGFRFAAPENNRNDRNRNQKHKKRKRADTSFSNNDECLSGKNPCPESEAWLFLKPSVDRDTRKEVHHIVSKNFQDFITSTKTNVHLNENLNPDATTTVITVQWSKRAQAAMLRKAQKKAEGEKGSQNSITATLCVMKKRNLEHMVAINHLSSALRCRQSDIGLCGIKDMCAVTYQFCTLNNILPYDARKANEILKHKSMQLGEFQTVDWKLNIGNHLGNQFKIKVRGMKEVETTETSNCHKLERIVLTSASCVHEAANRVYTNGFVNFFGEQRVGNAGPTEKVGARPFEIGRAMLQSEFSKAIDLLLQGREKDASGEYVEAEALRKIRQIWKDTKGDPELTLGVFPRNRNIMYRERTVLQGLKRYGSSKPLDAIRTLSTSIRMFWITAYQSYVWNRMATERLRRFGTKVVIGDLYIDSRTEEVRVVSNPDTVTLVEVVLPLPGFNIIYPTNIIGELYSNILREDGVQFRKDAVPEATAKGAYRHLIVKPEMCNTDCETNVNGELDATFQFQLPKGAFATMFLREIMASATAR
jgi:tRNA pseudouridine13 synthase